MARTKAELAEAIRKEDPSLGCARRLAEMTSCDYDEIAQRLTDTYAEWLGIAQPDENEEWADDYEESEYYLVNEIANEHLAEYLVSEEEEGWRELIRAEDGYDEADEDMTTEDVREYAQYVLNEIGRGFFFGQITDEMVAWADAN